MTKPEESRHETPGEIAVDKAELTLRDIIAQNEFTENHAVLKHEIEQIEDLFEITKGMLLEEVNANKVAEGPKRLGTVLPNKKRNMMFISSQTTNLISMRNLKMSLIKHQITLKTDMLDRNIKTLAQIAKDKTGGDDSGNPGAILDFLINNLNISIPISPQQRKDMLPFYGKDIDAEAELDAALEALDGKQETKRLENKTSPQSSSLPGKKYSSIYDKDENILVYNVEEDRVLVVTSGYDIVRELTSDEYELESLEDGTIIDKLTNTTIEIIGEE